MEWRKLENREIVDLQSYLKEWFSKNQNPKLYIGCDSHNTPRETTFAVVIVLHKDKSGGHVLYHRLSVPRLKSKHERLWKEVEISAEVAQTVMEYGIQPDYVDIDLNPNPKFPSNTLLGAAIGLIQSMGLEARCKHNSPWAISVADSLCK